MLEGLEELARDMREQLRQHPLELFLNGNHPLVQRLRDWQGLMDTSLQPLLLGLYGLEYARGDFAAAWRHYRRAWENRRDGYPGFTAITHLWALCRTACRRRDPVALQQTLAVMEAQENLQILEKLLIERARLLLWRARHRAASGSPGGGRV